MRRNTALITALVVLGGLVGVAAPAAADETTFCNSFITSLPFTISTQGHYCFNKNLATSIPSGNAITINVDFVVLDLNNFKLGGGNAGLGTEAVGVFSEDRRNITVRNGNIRGFKYGIRLIGDLAGNLVVENNVVDGNTYRGIDTDGDSTVVRNNTVSNTGGTTTPYTTWSYGIYADYSGVPGGSIVRDNVVINTFTTGTYGITGIAGSVVDHNVVSNGSDNGTTWNYGMWGSVCRDNTVFADVGYSCSDLVGANHPAAP